MIKLANVNKADMDSVTIFGKKFVPYIPYEEIMKYCDDVAARLVEEYGNSDEIPIILCTLNGAIMFTAELMKRLPFPCQLMSTKVKSYEGAFSTGVVHEALGITGNVEGRRVIIVEDIVDTGNTIAYLLGLLRTRNVKDAKVCTLLFKPSRYTQNFKIDYYGRIVEDKFILGFGLDYDERGRNLKDIYILDE